jgi:hypothetical protein
MPDSSIAFVPSQQLSDARLSQTHIHSWREQGFALVHDLLPQSLLVELKHDALHHYPASGTEAARSYNDFSSGQSLYFPHDPLRLTPSLCILRFYRPPRTCSILRSCSFA